MNVEDDDDDYEKTQGSELLGARDAVLAAAGYYLNCAPLAYESLLDTATCETLIDLYSFFFILLYVFFY